MPLNQQQTINNCPIEIAFSKAQKTYDHNSQVQINVGEYLINLLTRKKDIVFNSIIDLGCGTGLTTKKLAENVQIKNFSALDFSKSFLAEAKLKKYPNKINFILADFDQYFIQKPGSYDLIFANMAMQWSKDFISLLKVLFNNLSKSGQLIFSIPVHNTFNEIRTTCHINQFYKPFEVLTFLENCGFQIQFTTSKTYTLYFNSPIERLKSIKYTGANCYKGPRKKMSPLLLKQLKTAHNLNEKSFPLTYEIGIFNVKKTTGDLKQ